MGEFEGWRRLALPAMAAGVVALVVALVLLGLVSVLEGSQALLETTALTLVGASLPAFFAGLVSLDARRDWVRACGGIGLALCLGALVMFATWYPEAWGASLEVPNVYAVAQYVLGVTLMGAGASGGVAATITRPRRADPGANEASAEETVEIDLKPVDAYDWGAVPRDRPGVRLVLDDRLEEFEVATLSGNLVRVEEGDGVARAVDQLRALQGNIVERSTEPGVGDQVQRLQTVLLWDSIELEEVRPWWSKLRARFE